MTTKPTEYDLDFEHLATMIENLRNGDDAYYTPEAIDSAIASLRAADNAESRAETVSRPAGVPEGYVLVPVVPTEAMLEAAMQREDDEPLSDWGEIVQAPHEAIYAAMLTASQPQSGDLAARETASG